MKLTTNADGFETFHHEDFYRVVVELENGTIFEFKEIAGKSIIEVKQK